jgi:anti-anti-sigma regulatory factor
MNHGNSPDQRRESPMITHLRPPRMVHDTLGRPVVVVALPHRLDVHEVAAIHQEVRRLELRRGDRVALDASAVEHSDLAGLECLADVQTFCDGVGATVQLTNMSLALRLGIEFTGVVGVPAERPIDPLADFAQVAA